jgi:MFS family permease
MPMHWVMLLLLFLVRLSMGYQFQSVASLSTTLVEEFGFSYAEIGTLIGFFLLPGIVVSIPSGLMTRAVTDKNLLMLGAGAMAAGGIVMGMASNPSSLYWGRLLTGIGGSIFNVILTKMVSEWFFEKEIVTALGIMLTAWPIGIVLGLHTLAPIGELYRWNWAMYATAGLALFGLLLTLWFYREAPAPAAKDTAPPRFGLPMRQFIHMSAVAIAWTMLNAALIVAVSFGPGALVESGYDGASGPYGGQPVHVGDAVFLAPGRPGGRNVGLHHANHSGVLSDDRRRHAGHRARLGAGVLVYFSGPMFWPSRGRRHGPHGGGGRFRQPGSGIGDILHLVFRGHDGGPGVGGLEQGYQRHGRGPHLPCGGHDGHGHPICRAAAFVTTHLAHRNGCHGASGGK